MNDTTPAQADSPVAKAHKSAVKPPLKGATKAASLGQAVTPAAPEAKAKPVVHPVATAMPAAKAARKVEAPAVATRPPKDKVTVKAAVKAPALAPVLAPVKAATKTRSKPASAAPASVPAKDPSPKAPKVKLVRDSFTMPSDEYAALGELKQRALASAHPVKKSELLRAGIKLLKGLNNAALLRALKVVPAIKTGRPKARKGD